jgi:hypothetical protein
VRPRLHLVEQARVLDCDDGLVREDRNEFDLALRVWNRLAARERKGADRFAVPHQRHAKHGPYFAQACLVFFRIFWIGPGVCDLDCPIFQSDAPNQSPPAGLDFCRLLMPAVSRIDIHLARRVAVDVSVAAEDLAVRCVA